MPKGIEYPNARSVAVALKESLGNRGWQNVTARPWNMYYPDATLWWIIPAKAWPAFNHGKLFFCPQRAPDGYLLCGIHVEKGLDRSLEAAYSSPKQRRQIMKDDWTWFAFYADFGTGVVNSAINKVTREIDEPCIIRLEAGEVRLTDPLEREVSTPEWDLLVFETSGQGLDLAEQNLRAGFLSSLLDVRDIDTLARFIPNIRDYRGIWLDVFVGNYFETSQGSTSTTWDLSELWARALSAWGAWFK